MAYIGGDEHSFRNWVGGYKRDVLLGNKDLEGGELGGVTT